MYLEPLRRATVSPVCAARASVGRCALNWLKDRDKEAEGEEKERQWSMKERSREVGKERKGDNDEREKEVVEGKSKFS